MEIKKESSFAFLVMAYNHEKYILEHLESIKYLVETYGDNYKIDLIISDDCSIDQTKKIINLWLIQNKKLFNSIKTIFNEKNLGTCQSVDKMLSCVMSDRFKLSAGDDVYSFENIFEIARCDDTISIISGLPLYLIDNELKENKWSRIFAFASNFIYKNDCLLQRFKHVSYNNAPNILYTKNCVIEQSVRSYLKKFDVTEDWPIQIALARKFPYNKYKQINNTLMYYRRTEGSTYLVSNVRFFNDKILIYNDLIINEENIFEKLRLINRKYCFKLKNKLFKKLFNIDIYIFMVNFIKNFLLIYKTEKFYEAKLIRHKIHYKNIREISINFEKTMVLN